MSTQNSIHLSAAIQELSCSQSFDEAENDAAVASAGSTELDCRFVRFVQSAQRNWTELRFQFRSVLSVFTRINAHAVLRFYVSSQTLNFSSCLRRNTVGIVENSPTSIFSKKITLKIPPQFQRSIIFFLLHICPDGTSCAHALKVMI